MTFRLVIMCAAIAVVLGLTAAAARADGPSGGTPFQVTTNGVDPDVAVDDDGTAHIVWTHINPGTDSDSLEYCRIPRGKTTCDERQSFIPPLPPDIPAGSKAEGRPRVLLPGADHVILLTHRTGGVDFNALTGAVDPNCSSDGGGCVAEDHLTWAYESFDDGATFQAPKLIGVVPTEGGVISFAPTPPFILENAGSTPPNNVPVTTATPLVAGVSAGFESTSYNLGFQAAPLDGSATFDVADLGAGQTGASDSSAVGLTPAGGPLVLGHFASGLTWSRWNGGPLDDVISGDPTNWTGGQFSVGDYPTLASGPSGLYALTSTGATATNDTFGVRKYSGASGFPFGGQVQVATGVVGDDGQDFDEDSAGNLYGVVIGRDGASDHLNLLTSTNGQSWSTTTLASADTNAINRPTVGAASDGGGLAVYSSQQGANGTLTAIPFGATTSNAQIDVRVNAMEITQGVQTFELPTRNPANPLDNTVNYHGVAVPDTGTKPVIVKMADDNHPTVIRVYANTRSPLPKGLVPAMILRAFRNGKEIGPSPISPDINTTSFTREDPAELPVGNVGEVPSDAQTTPDAAYTFTLPSQWTSGDVTFQAEINPAGITPTVAQCARCRQYNILRLGPIHFTKIDPVYIQPVPLDDTKADGSTLYPLGSPDQAAPYQLQAKGEASTDPVYDLSGRGLIQTSRPTPFVGLEGVTPFTYHVFPAYHLVDASSVYRDKTLSYGAESAELANLVSSWATQVGNGFKYGLNYGHNATYFAGIIPSANGYSGGLTPGNGLLYGNGNTPVGVWSDDRPVNATAHEFGHTIGRVHAGLNCGSNTPPPNGQVGEAWAPDNNGDFWGVGLDMTAPSPYRILSWNETSAPTDSAVSAAPSAFYDLMSYCGAVFGSPDHWVSVTNWNRAVDFGASHVGDNPPGDEPALRPARTAHAARPTSLSVTTSYDLVHNQAQVIDVHPVLGSPTPATASSLYVLRALNAAGHVISQSEGSGALSRIEPSRTAVQTIGPIEITGLIPATAHAVQVLSQGQVIAQRTASAHAPAVRVTSPRRGQRVGAGGRAVIRWRASDADHDPLMVTVDYSPNGGATWGSIYEGSARPGRVVLPSRLLGHSTNARVRVSVNDGFHQTNAISPKFRALGAPPTVTITAPAVKARVAVGGNLNLSASAYDDHERPLRSKAIRWTAGRFLVGSGAVLSADDLPAGHYRLIATAKDSSGRAGSASVPIIVLPAKPLLRVFKVPRSVSRRAKTLSIKVAAITPAILSVGRHQFLVTRTSSTVKVSIKPGRKRLSIRFALRSGRYVVKLQAQVRRH